MVGEFPAVEEAEAGFVLAGLWGRGCGRGSLTIIERFRQAIATMILINHEVFH